MARAGTFALPAPGEGIMLPVYIDDLVEAVLLALEKGKPGRTYTAWDGRPVPFREYYARIAEIAGARPPRTLPRPVLELAGAVMEAWSKARGRPPLFTARAPTFIDRQGTASAQRARDELGWEPRVTLEEGLSRSAEWARAEGLLDA
jgi:nucleoside-diphosphate-sugar epimerase